MKSKQITFSDIEYGNRKRITKCEEFLDIMEEIRRTTSVKCFSMQ